MNEKIIGKVTATEKQPTTCNVVRFWVHQDVIIRPFDVVRIPHISKSKDKPSYTYAIVQELQYITDSSGHLANYISHDFGELDLQPQNDRIGTTVAEAEVLYNDQEIEMPVRDGASVEWADAAGIQEALGLRARQHPIPAGYICMSNGQEVPIEFEADYLLGPEGAHLNIAGISGLATKTSYAIFLMSSIQQRMAKRPAMIIFNVKGSDLLAIDESNPDLTEDEKAEWRKCNLAPIPFQSVTYLYPYGRRPQDGYTISHADKQTLIRQQEESRAFNFFYDVETAISKLALLFSDIDDPNSTMESIAQSLLDIEVSSWDDLRKKIVEPRTKKGANQTENIPVVSWRKFSRLLASRTENDLFTEKARTDTDKKRQIRISDAIKKMKPGDVLVIDVEPLPDYLQCFVFGDVIQTIYGIKLGEMEDVEQDALGTVVVFADELNKYAPKSSEGGKRTLTQNLLEITERGRSLGVVLFGAEQFRSGVHDRVLGNCSTNVYGRTSPVELAKCPDYRYFPEAYRSAIARLPKGSLLLQHAAFKTALIKVRFPYPAYYQPKPR